MKQSESIAKLAAALVTVHEHISPIVKDRTNPHFKNNYATLDAIMESVRPLLSGHGLSVIQGGAGPVSNNDGNIVGVAVETMLVHSSGEYVSSIIVLPLDKPSAQAVGSAVTYGRRYGVAALLALTTEEDDDGNVATANTQNRAEDKQPGNGSKPSTNGVPAVTAKAASGERACPKCGGAMWDNRASKTKATQPDFKCKNAPKERGGAGCIGVIWPPKEEEMVGVGGDDRPFDDYEPPY